MRHLILYSSCVLQDAPPAAGAERLMRVSWASPPSACGEGDGCRLAEVLGVKLWFDVARPGIHGHSASSHS